MRNIFMTIASEKSVSTNNAIEFSYLCAVQNLFIEQFILERIHD